MNPTLPNTIAAGAMTPQVGSSLGYNFGPYGGDCQEELRDVEYLAYSICALFALAMSVYFIWIYPRIADRLNDTLPHRGIARRLVIFPLNDLRLGSPENLAQARAAGYFGVLLFAYFVGSMIWDFARSAMATHGPH
jgi:hypothetical protein